MLISRLVSDHTIIAERPPTTSTDTDRGGAYSVKGGARKIARIISFDENTGAHIVRYASHLLSFEDDAERDESVSNQLEFNSEDVALILATRDYCILHRETDDDNFPMDTYPSFRDGTDAESPLHFGSRVESDVEYTGQWLVYTILSGRRDNTGSFNNEDFNGDNLSGWKYDLVSDSGLVLLKVPESRIRGQDAALLNRTKLRSQRNDSTNSATNRDFEQGRIFQRGMTIASVRRATSSSMKKSDVPAIGVLRRSWSAMAPLNAMTPLDLSLDDSKVVLKGKVKSNRRTRKLSIGGSEVDVNMDAVELPPILSVSLSLDEDIQPVSHNKSDITLYTAFQWLYQRKKRKKNEHLEHSCKCYYTITLVRDNETKGGVSEKCQIQCGLSGIDIKFGDISSKIECDGLNNTCMLCLQILGSLADEAKCCASDISSCSYERFQSLLVSKALTSKLLEQLEDPLSTVSGCLPLWCQIAPATSPHAFSHSSRKLLLERTSFGASRAALR